MYTVLGLGNPGSRYENTRHNIGHMVISELANRIGVQLSRHKQSGTYAASARIGMAPGELGEQVILAISQGYMNTTGGPTASLLAYFNASP
ncbi:MAG: aminoacyl-tRNA hydrolase, partial [Actinomycetaceae bacterium]|nr:aminoacyl-tRNA hydrolase [Actinomycetaceae bacterium]